MSPKTSFRFVIDERAKCVLVAWAGGIQAQSMAESLRTILADPLFEPGMRFLHDCRRATFSEVDLVTLGKFVPSARDYDSKRGVGRSAVVVGTSLDYGIVRQFALLVHGLDQMEADRQPFYEMEDACAWLDLDSDVLESLPVTSES